MRKQYRSPLMASIHETAEGLHAAGVMDKRTMREFDDLCLTPVRLLKPKEIRALRLREGAKRSSPVISM
jgi:putative transcriptional regulator